MPTRHQEKHLRALKLDAEDLDGVEKTRVLKETNDILDEKVEWPVELTNPYEIHEWVERPDDGLSVKGRE